MAVVEEQRAGCDGAGDAMEESARREEVASEVGRLAQVLEAARCAFVCGAAADAATLCAGGADLFHALLGAHAHCVPHKAAQALNTLRTSLHLLQAHLAMHAPGASADVALRSYKTAWALTRQGLEEREDGEAHPLGSGEAVAQRVCSGGTGNGGCRKGAACDWVRSHGIEDVSRSDLEFEAVIGVGESMARTGADVLAVNTFRGAYAMASGNAGSSAPSSLCFSETGDHQKLCTASLAIARVLISRELGSERTEKKSLNYASLAETRGAAKLAPERKSEVLVELDKAIKHAALLRSSSGISIATGAQNDEALATESTRSSCLSPRSRAMSKFAANSCMEALEMLVALGVKPDDSMIAAALDVSRAVWSESAQYEHIAHLDRLLAVASQ
mmetsp:Transcript_10597/g.28237  ORF Transcript_10597/g.28237 Transcript_10597/m.28237 type:complete len:389 (+) Transcript_10597:93-1259(+)|eukprot:CAMPEP_0185833792 /NCGR_PEP_ID=MMETSP1353-20130828/3472_1 /TAXON_ID=1077150 /ORGANISM="Erythrolobus australicus, Strain CCMP3124" /LENGTH=388 /DNA_ID=CAMNT_0028532119 /DNA_START=68 /DNA_END=1234 /DNA_ORIENTATION=+